MKYRETVEWREGQMLYAYSKKLTSALLILVVTASSLVPTVLLAERVMPIWQEPTVSVVSNWAVSNPKFDGRISSEFEWVDANPQTIELYRDGNGSYYPDDKVQVTYFVKNDAEWLYLLVHANFTDKVPVYTDISYFWPDWHGTWANSTLAGLDTSNHTREAYGWNETVWLYTGTNNVEGAASCSKEREVGLYVDCWFEYAKRLRSGNRRDWNLVPGEIVGARPPDLLVYLWFLDGRGYQRYITLYLSTGDFPSLTYAPEFVTRFDGGGSLYSLSMNNDGSLIATGTRNPSELRLYSRDGTLLWKKAVVRSWAAYDVALSGDGRYVAVGTDWGLQFFSTDGNKLWERYGAYVYSVAMSDDGSRIAYRGGGWLNVVDRNGTLLWHARPAQAMGGVSVSPDGKYVVVLGEDSWYPGDKAPKLFLYDRNGEMLWNRTLPEFTSNVGSRYSAPAISRDANAIALTGMDGKLRLFNQNGELVWELDSGTAGIPMEAGLSRLVAMPTDGRYIAVGVAAYGRIRIFSSDGIEQANISQGLWSGIALSSDGSYIAAGTSDFGLYSIPSYASVQAAIDLAGQAIQLGAKLAINMDNAESLLRVAKEHASNGGLGSAYDSASKAYHMAFPLLRPALESMLNETKSTYGTMNSTLQSIDKESELWGNVSSVLNSARALLISAQTDIENGKLAYYGRAFRSLSIAKHDLLEAQLALQKYKTHTTVTMTSGIAPMVSSELVAVIIVALVAACLAVLTRKRRKNAAQTRDPVAF